VPAVLFGCLAGASFGALAVTVRFGLLRGVDAETGAAAGALIAAVLSALVTIAAGASLSDFGLDGVWPFLAIGAFVPGCSQILFVRAIRDAGPSRTAILIGTAPLLSALIAIAALDEPFGAALAIGTVLVVLGGSLLAWERTRPHGFKLVGAFLALAAAALFAARDNAVRSVADGSSVPALVAATASLAAAAVVLVAYVLVARREQLARRAGHAFVGFLPAGVSLAVAYDALVAAFDRGRVTIVAPLNATQSLWAVVFSLVVMRRTELIGRRVVAAAGLVVAGGAVIGVFR